jgi:hypothetical protein
LNTKHKQFADYGGRGITVCDKWLNSFEDFLADVGEKPSPRLTLDRINNDGNYEPGNVAWRTRKHQQANRRKPNGCHQISFAGKTQSLQHWSEEIGVKRSTLSERLRSGWSVTKALTTPSR